MSARTEPPVKFVGAAHFDRDADDLDPASLIRIAKTCGLLEDLRRDTDHRQPSVRQRIPGEWGLAFLAFAASPIADIRPWWRDSGAEVWWECGFRQRPPYHTVYERFCELEEKEGIEHYFEGSVQLIRLAIAGSGGVILRDIAVDAAEAESNARMFHDCQPGEDCPWARNGGRPGRRGGRTRNGEGQTTQRLDSSEAKRIRGRAAEVLPEDESAPLIGDADRLVYDEERELLRIEVAGHWWRITDPTAGCRTYTGPRGGVKSWIGMTHLRVASTEVGLSAVTEVASASEPEFDVYPRAYEKLKYILEGVPRSVIADKGQAIKRIFQMHSDDGVFSVMPFRGGRHEPLPLDRERYDRHGIPRCENCGGRTKFVSFTKRPKARIFFECATKSHAECHGRQSLLCSEDPRFILPLWRDSELYQALRTVGIEHERVHRMARQRSATGGNNFYTRPKRKGRDWQQLVANATLVADWLKLCWRNGWLPGSTCRVDQDATAIDGSRAHARFLQRRHDKGLDRPYGERAYQLGLGPRRVRQYRDATPLPPQAPARPVGGPARRPLTPLPSHPVGWPTPQAVAAAERERESREHYRRLVADPDPPPF